MNPGAPPPPPGYGWAPQPGYYGGPPMKSTTPRTLGTLSMVFGGVIGGLSLLTIAMGKPFGAMTIQASQREAFEHYLASLHTYSMVQAAVMLVMSAALFYIGFGQRGYQRWATGATVTWGIVALLVVVGQAIGAYAVAMPALETFGREIAHGNAQAAPIIAIGKIMAFVSLALYAPYPIVLISSFRKADNIAAMDQ